MEFPLKSICIGFEVINFEHVIEHMGVIISRLASFPLAYDFLYLVPLLDGASYSPNVWRISSDSVSSLIAGTSQPDPWMLLPVEAPSTLITVLPEIRYTVLPEFDILSRFYNLYSELNGVRNTAYFVVSRLDAGQKYDVQLGEQYKHQLQHKADEILESYSNLIDEMLNFDHEDDESIQRLTWIEFYQRCREKFEDLRNNLNVDLSAFESIKIWQDRELKTLFGSYLNAKHRYHLIDTIEQQADGDVA